VKLKGLKVAHSRGKYYVYLRSTGDTLIKGFEGNKEALLKRLAMPDMLGAYNVKRKRDPKSYPERTLGWLVAWFTDPKQCPEFANLAEVTQGQYKDGLAWLEPEYDCPLDSITRGELYDVRNRCVAEKWPTFADHMIKALSSMFTKAVDSKKMAMNPAIGMTKARKADPNANREWRPEEWDIVFAEAPLKFKIVMMIARYIGYRGQSIVQLQWSNYQPDPDYGKCFRFTHKKNDEPTWLPARIELQEYLDGLKVRALDYIAVKHNGKPWKTEKQLQTAFSNWIASLKKRGLVSSGLTLHGLRVTYAANIKRDAFKDNRSADNSAVAAALGDRDERMGAHYTRHVENEIKVIQAFPKPAKKKVK
jgi:integrase